MLSLRVEQRQHDSGFLWMDRLLNSECGGVGRWDCVGGEGERTR